MTFEMRYVDPRTTRDPFTFRFVLKKGTDRLPLEFQLKRMVNGGYVEEIKKRSGATLRSLPKKAFQDLLQHPTLYPVSRRQPDTSLLDRSPWRRNFRRG